MEKSVSRLSRKKFLAMPQPRRHKMLALLAEEALVACSWPAFFARYEEMHSWCELDRFQPPHWLTPEEAVRDCAAFHRVLSGKAEEIGVYELPEGPARQAAFAVDVVLDSLRSPFNMGSLLRLMDNFGFGRVVHCSPWLSMDHPQLRRSARGCDRWIPVQYEPDLPAYLDRETLPVVAVETGPRSMSLYDWQPPAACCLLLGNEKRGISQALLERAETVVSIPMYGYKKSMNVVHAFTVVASKIVARHGRELTEGDRK